jgi:glutamate carboxypeptidase
MDSEPAREHPRIGAASPMHEQALWDHLRPRRDEMMTALARLVEHESPSGDKGALDALARVLAERLGARGGDVAVLANARGGDHVVARYGGAARSAAPALVLGHFDTVWPQGTLSGRPVRVEDGRGFGPGIFDMKAGLVVFEFAVGAVRALGISLPRPVVALFTSDEEIGSPSSRPLIEDHARRSAYALVLEPPLAGGRLKTARKGVGRFTLAIEGRAAHAGVEPENGVSAVFELARQVLHLHDLADPAAGTTLNIGVVQGGTTPNVVAARATAEVDVRAGTRAEALRIDEAIRALRPITPGARVRVSGGFNRPPMERSAAIAALFRQAQRIGRALGLELDEGATGGGSDGNFTAALGVPTLDGLGAAGAGAHAEDEHIVIASLPERAALLAALLLGLEGDPGHE